MKKRISMRRLASAFAVLTLILTFMLCLPHHSLADPAKDYVIVIDVSTSMDDIFDEVKQIAKRTIGEASAGDNVALITFGEQAILLSRMEIRNPTDIENIQKQIDQLYPTEYATYISRGMEKGLAELRYLFEKNPDRERVLVWLSDDKDNPPKELGKNFLTYDKLREEHKRFEPGKDWFDYNAPLSEVKNENLVDFVTWARRTTYGVSIKEPSVNLGAFESKDVKKTVMLTFEPKHPGAAGLEFAVSAEVTDPKNPDKRLPVNFSPKRLTASGQSWQQEFQIAFAGEPGEYKGNISFQSSAPLDVQPKSITMTAMIAPPKVVPVEPIAPAPKPETLLGSAKEKGIIATEDRPPGLTRPERPLTFGPLDPGKRDSKMITLYLNKEVDPKTITHVLSLQLPKGFTVESEVFGRGTRKEAEIIVSVDATARIPEESLLRDTYNGSMSFKSSEKGVEVLPVYIPVSVTLNPDRVRWGGKLLPETGAVGQVKARGMTFEELTKTLEKGPQAEESGPVSSTLRSLYSNLKSRYIFFPVLGAIAIALILLLYRMRPPSELFVGELVVIKDPTDSKMKNINLKRIGSLHGKDVLVMGSSLKSDIRLGHPSVSPIHGRFLAKSSGEQVEVTVAPIKGCPIKVNDVEILEKTRLSDKDLIGIGDFILLFSNPEAQKEIVVHFLDGRTMRGTPVTWDIGSAGFELLRTDAPETEETAEEISVVNFNELKAVFFMQDSSGTRPGIPRERINTSELFEVTFFDGEKVEGNPLVDYSDTSGRFYLVPSEMPNIISILIERGGVRDVVKQKARVSPEAGRPEGVGLLRKRKGATPAE
ncbi:MAG: VWA domain-containing protein [Candidatus Lindowbacteria bacterium]|nr:VWA domain-containing protein [Candidatus Lindowbacteria bacterium]